MDPESFSSSTTAIFGSGLVATEPVTVVRTRGYFEIQLIATAAALDGFNWAAGVGIVSADAFAVGVTAVPNPFDDIDWGGWLWHQQGAMHNNIATIGRENVMFFDYDSKAMRKLGVNEVLFVSMQVGEIGTATMNVRTGSRCLFKLH